VRTLILLIIEVEPPEGISARKLVLETSKHNVLTAYSGEQGLALLRRFPNVDAVVVHTQLKDLPCSEVAHAVRQLNPKLPIISISPNNNACEPHDFSLSSHEPQQLLQLLADEFDADTRN
jgi:CheY-like chemotaxis protein